MNKPLLLIICDFLLISLLALARFDVEEMQKKVEPEPETVTDAGPQQDLIDALEMSLEEERLAREKLDNLLDETRTDLQKSQSELAEREQEVKDKEQQLADQEKKAREMAAEQAALEQKLASSQAKLTTVEKEFETSKEKLTDIQREYAATRASLDTLENQYQTTQERLDSMQDQFADSKNRMTELQAQLSSAKSEARVNQQLVQRLESDLTQTVTENQSLQTKIQKVDQERQLVLVERQKIEGQLKVVETEKKMTQQQLATAQKEINVVREEKAAIQEQATQLAENVSTLADDTDKLTKEIRTARPLTPNAIFSDYISNRVHSTMQASKPGFLGKSVKKEEQMRSVLFNVGDQTYAVYHISDTPLELTAIGTEWQSLFLTLRHGGSYVPLPQFGFLERDPRIIVAPVSPAQLQKISSKVYKVPQDLFQFEEAVLVGSRDNYYGECAFQIDPETPGFMKMQRERFGRLFGKFVPSRGDLVFTKSGDIIGIMVNKDYCLVFDRIKTSRNLNTGTELRGQLIAAYLSQMYFRFMDSPLRLR